MTHKYKTNKYTYNLLHTWNPQSDESEKVHIKFRWCHFIHLEDLNYLHFFFFFKFLGPVGKSICMFVCQTIRTNCSMPHSNLELDSNSNAKCFFITLSHAYFHFWGHECLSNRLISKRYPKSNASPWVEESSTSRAFHTHDTWYFWLSENTLHERFITKRWHWAWMQTLQLTINPLNPAGRFNGLCKQGPKNLADRFSGICYGVSKTRRPSKPAHVRLIINWIVYTGRYQATLRSQVESSSLFSFHTICNLLTGFLYSMHDFA